MTWQIENFLEGKSNELHINGVSAVELANRFETPLFVFSESRIKSNIERLKRVESVTGSNLMVCYAAKANSNMAILRTVMNAGGDLEVNSGGELYKALKVGFAPRQIIFNGTSKTESELEDAINAGIYAIQSDSIFELELTEKVARRLGKRANVSLRIVPEIETDTHPGLKTAMNTSKFGMTVFDALSAFSKWKPDDQFLNLCGIHLHIGSQTPDPEPYSEAFAFLWKMLRQIYQETGHRLAHINLGGGFPVNYLRDTSQASDIPESQRKMFSSDFEPAVALKSAWKTVEDLAAADGLGFLLKDLTILLEPGRSVIADAGIVLTTVRNKKERPAENIDGTDTWLMTDAGYNIMLSMNNYKWYYHLISASRTTEAHKSPYKLAGPLCDGGDVYFDIEGTGKLPDYRLLPENTGVGDVLALLNCGAYSLAQMFPYNGRPLPAAVLIHEDGNVELIRKRDTYETLIESDIW